MDNEPFKIPSTLMAEYQNFSPKFYLDLVMKGVLKIGKDNVLEKVEPEWKPREDTEYDVEEKVKAFDQLHAMAMAHYHDTKENGSNEDACHYFYEAVMELLSQPDQKVWDTFNKFI